MPRSGQHLGQLVSSPYGVQKRQLSPVAGAFGFLQLLNHPLGMHSASPGRESNRFMKAAISGFPQIASSTDKWLLCNAVYGLVSGNGISLPFRCSHHRKHIYFFSSVIFSTKLHKSLYLGKCFGNILLCVYFAAQLPHERKNRYVLLGKQLWREGRERAEIAGKENLVFSYNESVPLHRLSAPLMISIG